MVCRLRKRWRLSLVGLLLEGEGSPSSDVVDGNRTRMPKTQFFANKFSTEFFSRCLTSLLPEKHVHQLRLETAHLLV